MKVSICEKKAYQFDNTTVVIYYILHSNNCNLFISLNLGNDGVSIKLFGGGDDGYFYWTQARNIANEQPAILTSIYPLIIGYLTKITGIENVYIIRLFNYCGFVLLTLLSIKLIEVIIKLENKEKELTNIKEYTYLAQLIILIGYLCYVSLIMNVNLSIYRDIWIYLLYVLCMFFSIKLIFSKVHIVL